MRAKFSDVLCLVFFVSAVLPGCAVSRSTTPGKTYDVKWPRIGETLVDGVLDIFTDDEYDKLWKQGYGFNNPNSKRSWENRP